MAQQYSTLTEMFDTARKMHGEKLLFFNKDEKKNFYGLSLSEAMHRAENIALCLLEDGVQPGDRIGQMADNRAEWAIADMAVLMTGACNVPRGTDSTAQEIEYILNHSEAKICIVEHEAMLKKIQPILPNTQVTKVIVMEKNFQGSNPNEVGMYELIERGEKLRKEKMPELEKRKKSIKPDDLFTIIYTSGTTGAPKGVMLSHGNMIYNIVKVPPMVGMVRGDRALSILPVWHIFERAIDYGAIALGVPMYYTNVRDLRDDFAKVKPTFMASAPRLWENIYQGIKAKVEKAEPLQQKIFEVAYEINKLWRQSVDYLKGNDLKLKPESDLEKLGKTAISLFTAVNLFVPAKVLDSVVFSKMRAALGGAFRGTISGGGALPAHVDEFFNVIGIPVYEGYGMTECAPIIAVRDKNHLVQGSVGISPDGTEVAVLDDKGNPVPIGELGVIHVRGPQVMKGYYKNEEATKSVLKNGWLNTGDLGFYSYNGTLSVRGRVKDTIVLLGGENVEPVPIENLLLQDEFINQVIVVGQDQKTLTALIWPDKAKLREAGFSFSDDEDLNKNEKIRQHFLAIIKKYISAENGFKSFERITDFRFLPKPMEVGDELTNLFKMKRNVITQKYDALIKSMY